MSDYKTEIEYLTNFWIPKDLHTVVNKQTSEKFSILRGPVDADKVQYVFNDGKVHFIQDYEWEPTLPEVLELFETLGVEIYEDQMKWQKHFLPKPHSIMESIAVLRQIRQLSLVYGDDIVNKLLSNHA